MLSTYLHTLVYFINGVIYVLQVDWCPSSTSSPWPTSPTVLYLCYRWTGVLHVLPRPGLPHLRSHIFHSPSGQRSGLLRSICISPYAYSHQSLHRQPGCWRYPNGVVLRALHICHHPSAPVLALRTPPLLHCQLQPGNIGVCESSVQCVLSSVLVWCWVTVILQLTCVSNWKQVKLVNLYLQK